MDQTIACEQSEKSKPARSLGQEQKPPPQPTPPPPQLNSPHPLTPLISQDFLSSRSIWRKLRICRDLFYSSYDISWLGICTSCRKKLAMLMKGVTANKTDKDEPEVRRSSRLAEKSPVSFEHESVFATGNSAAIWSRVISG